MIALRVDVDASAHSASLKDDAAAASSVISALMSSALAETDAEFKASVSAAESRAVVMSALRGCLRHSALA